jgi:hypothetical protein
MNLDFVFDNELMPGQTRLLPLLPQLRVFEHEPGAVAVGYPRLRVRTSYGQFFLP